MKRGDIYLVSRPPGDPRPRRAMVVVSRQVVIDANIAAVICAPVGSAIRGIDSEVRVGSAEGLRQESTIQCDDLRSIAKTSLTNYVGSLGPAKLADLKRALIVALDLED